MYFVDNFNSSLTTAEGLRGYLDLHIISDLYDSQSHFWRAVKSSSTVMQDLPLRIDDNDTRKFLTQISFPRQLGVPEYDIDNIECQKDMINEQAYQMLLKWKTISGRGATYGVLVNAIFAVDEHTNCLNDACCYIEKYILGRQ